MTAVLHSSTGTSLVKTGMRRRTADDANPNGVLQCKTSSLERLSAFRTEQTSNLSHSNHELSLEISQMRRRGAIAASSTSAREREAHTTSTPCLQTISENAITVSVQSNGLLLLHNMIRPTGNDPIHTLLQPLLDQLEVGCLSDCTVTLHSIEEEEEEELDLLQPSQNYCGQHIIVDISSNLPYALSEDNDPSDKEMNGWQVSSVQQCLNHFDTHGISPLPGSQTPGAGSFPSQVELPDLPSSWRSAVDPVVLATLDAAGGKAEDLQQYIWELIQTEHSHIQQLQTAVNVFMQALEYIMAVDILTEVNYNNIFGSMRDILSAHEDLWTHVLLPCWLRVQHQRQLFDLDDLLEHFPKFAVQFEIYEQHCIFEAENLRALNQAVKKQDFKAYLVWCEARPECQRLKLKDFLAKPMQRLTKYVLLLRNIAKATEEPSQVERMDNILSEVDNFVAIVNGTLQSQEEVGKVKDVMNQIDGYSAVTSAGEMERVLQPYTHIDLLAPIPGVHMGYPRTLFYHDTMRFKGSEGKDTCRVFVFTDLLLVAKTVKRGGDSKLDVIIPPCRIDYIVVRAKDNVSFFVVTLNEFGLATAAFSLRADSTEKAQNFRKQVERAQLNYEQLVEENSHVARYRSTASPGMYADSTGELLDSFDREKWSTVGRIVPTPTHERILTSRVSGQSLVSYLTTPDHLGHRSASVSMTPEGSQPAEKSSPVGAANERHHLRSPEINVYKAASTSSSTPLLAVSSDREATRLRHATPEDDNPERQKALYVSFVPLNKADQNGRLSHTGSVEVSDAEEQQDYKARKLSVELHRVDTIRTTMECALVSFSDIRSLSPDSDEPATQPAIDTHSTGSSSLDLTIVTSGSDGMREVGETTESDSRLSSAAGVWNELTVRPATATAGGAEHHNGGLHGKLKNHKFFSSEALDSTLEGSRNARAHPLKRFFNFHPLWKRSKAKSLPGYRPEDKCKNSKKSPTPQSNHKPTSDLDSPVGDGGVGVVVAHGPTWV